MNLEVDDRPKKYMEQYLQKKEANGKWIEYWVICRGIYLLFYSHKCESTELRDSFRGSIELTPGSKCTISKRKKYSFPFFLSTSKARYYFKSPTLLLRHQWIHAINLSVLGALPESLPNSLLLPPLQDPQSSQSDEEICHVESRAEDSENNSIAEMPLQFSVNEDDHADIDIPSNFILVRSRSPDSDDVVDFLSGERKKETSNFLVTNFVNSRNADNTKSSKIGIDNLSFEAEDSSTRVLSATKRQNNNAIESQNSGMRTPQGSPLPQFCLSTPPLESNSSGRLVRSAGSIRDCSPNSRLPSSMCNDLYLPVRTSASNINVNENRFSRHFVSSAPDLKLFTTTNA